MTCLMFMAYLAIASQCMSQDSLSMTPCKKLLSSILVEWDTSQGPYSAWPGYEARLSHGVASQNGLLKKTVRKLSTTSSCHYTPIHL